MQKERKSSLDLVRSCAIFLVVIHHSVSLSGVLSGEIGSPKWYIGLFLRHLTFCCVPLFLMLSGYLQNKKKFSLTYFKGIIPLLISYTAIGFISFAAKSFYNQSTSISPARMIIETLNFTANDYSWYFEMYIGLFLLIPFINYASDSPKPRRGNLSLLAVLAFLTLLPLTLKSFSPAYSANGEIVFDMIPDFFTSLYPVFYYLVGSYFAKYKPFAKVNRVYRLLVALCAPLIPFLLCTAFSLIRGSYSWYMMNGFNTLCAAFTAVCVFALLYDLEVRSCLICALLKFVSNHTFETYLFSFIFDSFCYSYLKLPIPVIALIVFISSLASAFLLKTLITTPLTRLILKVFLPFASKFDQKSSNAV